MNDRTCKWLGCFVLTLVAWTLANTRAIAQVTSVADQFNAVVPEAPNGEVVVITLRNPSACGTTTYKVFMTEYSSNATTLCSSSPKGESFTGSLVRVCPTTGTTTIGNTVVHQIIVPTLTNAPTWVSIAYAGTGTDTHLQADMWVYTADPTGGTGTILTHETLVRDGLIR